MNNIPQDRDIYTLSQQDKDNMNDNGYMINPSYCYIGRRSRSKSKILYDVMEFYKGEIETKRVTETNN